MDRLPLETDCPDAVRIQHHKTGELVPLPLLDTKGPLFPELTTYLDGLERLGIPVVLLKPKGKKPKPARPFKMRDARARVRRAAVTPNCRPILHSLHVGMVVSPSSAMPN